MIKITIFSGLIILLFSPVILKLITIWSTNADYSHGFLVIPISVFMLWKKRQKIFILSAKPSWIGLPILIAGLICYLLSFFTNFNTLIYFSMLLIIFSLLLFLIGWQLTKELLTPILFLIFMFPIPTAYYILITNPLKIMITKISAQIIYFTGIPVYREGNLLFFANFNLQVVEACSGVRSLYSYIMLSCIFALMSKKQLVKIIMVLSAIPLAIIINIMRVTGTGILSHYCGPRIAQGFFHEFTGLSLFSIGFMTLFLIYYLLNWHCKPYSGSHKTTI